MNDSLIKKINDLPKISEVIKSYKAPFVIPRTLAIALPTVLPKAKPVRPPKILPKKPSFIISSTYIYQDGKRGALTDELYLRHKGDGGHRTGRCNSGIKVIFYKYHYLTSITFINQPEVHSGYTDGEIQVSFEI